MHRRRHLTATAVTVVGLIVIAGCGSSTTAQFKAGYAAAQAPLNRTYAAVLRTFAHAKGKTVEQIASSLGTLAKRFGRELGPLEALKPPASVKTAFVTLTASLNRVERDLQGAYLAIKAKNLVAAQQPLTSLRSDATAATDAAAAITHKLG